MSPRGTVGRIYKEDHHILLLAKYEKVQVGKDLGLVVSEKKALGLVVSEKKIFLCFSHCVFLWELMTPGAGPFCPQGHDCQDL